MHRPTGPHRRAADVHGTDVRDLADRLQMEYGGAVPPHRVSGTVYRTYRTVVQDRVAADLRLSTCELIVRRRLTDMVAGDLGHVRTAPARPPRGGGRTLG